LKYNQVIYRVDNGGALRYRAMGAPKGRFFGSVVGELDTMRGLAPPSPPYVELFASISDEDLRRQIDFFALKMQSAIEEFTMGSLKQTLQARYQYLLDWNAR